MERGQLIKIIIAAVILLAAVVMIARYLMSNSRSGETRNVPTLGSVATQPALFA